eukprot:scaffold5362_cov67-Phaeocystis_antarctica.AAC.1
MVLYSGLFPLARVVEEGRVLHQACHLWSVALTAPAAARERLLHLPPLKVVLVAVLVPDVPQRHVVARRRVPADNLAGKELASEALLHRLPHPLMVCLKVRRVRNLVPVAVAVAFAFAFAVAVVALALQIAVGLLPPLALALALALALPARLSRPAAAWAMVGVRVGVGVRARARLGPGPGCYRRRPPQARRRP